MFFIDVMYYYYYLFYSSIYKESDPEFTAKLSLSASESFLVVAIASIISAFFFGHKFGRVEFIASILIILGLNFGVILRPKREEKILKSEPKLLKSNKASVIIAWFFFLFTTSILFWLNDVVNFFIEIRH